MSVAVLTVAAVLPLLAAVAGDVPLLAPTRDVDVRYQAAGRGEMLSERMRWRAEPRMLRVDPPTAGLYVIVDYAAHRMTTVREADRSVFQTPAPVGFGGVPPAGSYVRGGEDSVAGLPCTEWRTHDIDGRATDACITTDGVLLRARVSDRTLISAVSVVYGALDPAVFRVPDGYTLHMPPEPPR